MVLPAAVSDGRPAAPAVPTKAGTAHVAGNGQVAAASAAKATASPASHPKQHPNVGKAHSPRLLKELAGPSGTSGPVINSPAQAATAGPVNGAAQGIDVASFQHPGGAAIDWQQVASDGITFAAVKVTEGDYYANTYAASDLTDAGAAGLTTVAYAYAIPDGDGSSSSPVRQADDLINYLTSHSVTVPPVMLDIEYNPNPDGTGECYGLSNSAMVNWIAGFNKEIRTKTGHLPLIYTTQGWWSDCTGGSTALANTPVWAADPTNSSPALPAGWSTWNLWQYSSAGSVNGISGNVDLDQLNPGLITLLNHGDRSYVAGSTTLASQVAPFTVGSAPSLTYSATGLPAGLAMLADGRISGWPDSPGTYHPVVTAKDTSGTTGSSSFTWTINPAPSAGPTGTVRLGTGGKCLEDYRNRTRNGNPIVTRACNGSAQQRWILVQDNTMRIHGRCLALSSGHAVLEACNGSAAQHWRVGTGDELVNASTGKCLAGSATSNGVQAWTGGCTGASNKEWKLVGGPVLAGTPGKCLDDTGNVKAVGNHVVTAACNGSAEQNWLVKPDGSIRIHSMCLDVTSSGVTVLNSCASSPPPQWQIPASQIPAGGSGSNLARGSQCLAYQGDGAQANLGACPAGDPAVTWRIR
jgi:GH25 family lysozyme M1 (1,4-beta-N-acetylmuramidase)